MITELGLIRVRHFCITLQRSVLSFTYHREPFVCSEVVVVACHKYRRLKTYLVSLYFLGGHNSRCFFSYLTGTGTGTGEVQVANTVLRSPLLKFARLPPPCISNFHYVHSQTGNPPLHSKDMQCGVVALWRSKSREVAGGMWGEAL